MRRYWVLGCLSWSLAACSANWGGASGPVSQQNPLIASFEVRSDPSSPSKGPFQLRALASGMGLMSFSWNTTGGLLSVASESMQAATASLVPTMTLWQPPRTWGQYQVNLTVSDSGGGTYSRSARFKVGKDGTMILSPRPSSVGPFPAGGQEKRGPWPSRD